MGQNLRNGGGNMRRLLALLTAFVLFAGLAGCGAAEPEPELAPDGRRILTLGLVNTVPEARTLVSLFNAQSGEYKVEIVEYKYGGSGSTPDDLTLELATGDAPDILVTETDSSFESAQASGLFVELSGLLDELAPELVPCMYEALRAQDAVYALPFEFGVWTFLTQPSRVDGRESLTMEEAEQCAAQLGEGAKVFQQWMTRTELFKRVVSFAAGKYIDWETASCDFESEGFLGLLELCMGQRADDSPYPEEQLCLLESYLLTAENWFGGGIQLACGEDYCFMGFPGQADGAQGWLTPGMCFYATAAGDTEGAMEFLRFVLGPKAQEQCESFPMLQSELDGRQETAVLTGLHMQSDAEKLNGLLGSGLASENCPQTVTSMLIEEAQAYFAGDCTLETAAARMQDRVSTYLAEHS